MKGPFHYEQLIRVPLIICYPKGTRAGATISSPVSLVDLASTWSQLCGLAQEDHRFDGVSLAPVLEGSQEGVRQSALIECVNDTDGLRLKTIVTGWAKLTWYPQRDYGELYDLANDPREKKNLWNDPDHAKLMECLLTELLGSLEFLESHSRQARIGHI